MKITVKYFGIIADFTKVKDEIFVFNETVNSIESLQSALEEKYPQIKNVAYTWALNQKLTNQSAKLHDQDEIALLPPFSGG